MRFRDQTQAEDLAPMAGSRTRTDAQTSDIFSTLQSYGVDEGPSWQPPPTKAARPRTQRQLSELIECDIIPRLMLVNTQSEAPSKTEPHKAAYTPDAVATFAGLLVAGPMATIEAFVRGEFERGASLETICLDLFAPAARQLGVGWETDDLDFMQVSLAVSRLQQLLHTIRLPSGDTPVRDNRSILLAPAPGEQHWFGLQILGEFMRKEGWDVHAEMPTSLAEIKRIVRSQSFEVVAFSLGNDRLLNELAAGIQMVRQCSRNKAVAIMVGGRVFAENPELCSQVGADAVAKDARMATRLANTLAEAKVGIR
jgi:MerR family transcriptional regulator, light-induced transcriptional regulator